MGRGNKELLSRYVREFLDMNKKKLISIIDRCDMSGDDWALAEVETGLILLQRESNKAKSSFTNLKSR